MRCSACAEASHSSSRFNPTSWSTSPKPSATRSRPPPIIVVNIVRLRKKSAVPKCIMNILSPLVAIGWKPVGILHTPEPIPCLTCKKIHLPPVSSATAVGNHKHRRWPTYGQDDWEKLPGAWPVSCPIVLPLPYVNGCQHMRGNVLKFTS